MAVSRTASKNTNVVSPSGRISFAKIHEPLEVPNLLDLQIESFDWLIGNDAWQARVAAAREAGRTDVNTKSGLEEIFEEISPIEDLSQTMSLSFRDNRFEEPKHTVEECKDQDFTYAAPLFVTAEFMNNETGEIKSQTVFMGDFPLMTDKGTFVINGTERVVVTQLVRSPGVYFEQTADKTSDKDIFTCKMIPSRGAWLEFEIDKRDMVGVRVDRKRKQNVTVLLKALGWTDEQILEEFGEFESIRLTLEKDHTANTDEALLDIYRKLRPGEPPTREAAQAAAGELLLQPEALRPGQGRPVQDQQEAGHRPAVRHPGSDHRRHRRGDPLHRRAARGSPRGTATMPVETDDIDHFGNRRLRTVGELIQNQLRIGLGRHGAGRPGPDDDPGHRGDHAADPDQHPSGRRGAEGVLRHLAAVAVHGPDQPGRRPHPQAAAVGPRPGRSLPGSRRHGGPRRPPQPLRPDVPDRDARRPQHRPDRLPGLLRPGERVRLHRDALPEGGGRATSPTRSTT